jgi:putative N6-adenine-specific DNA methylase
MPRFFATCGRGLEPVLAAELTRLAASGISPGRGGVHFAGDATLLYRANLHLRTAVRVLLPVLEADVGTPDDLYDAVRSVDWSQYLTPSHTLAVDANVRDSRITHSQYAARRVKDAICDQFREKTGVRPSVDADRPMVGLNLHLARDHMVLSLDSSWDSLHKRGYRPALLKAPLNEALAAGLLLHVGFDGSEPLADPMCGAGTFCIEGAWMATQRPPGLTRKWFGFQGWPDFDAGLWAAVREEARQHVSKSLAHPIVGSDMRKDAVASARENAKAAGVGHLVRFSVADVAAARPPDGKPGLVMVNPPYGERIGDEKELVSLYRTFGTTVRDHWPGWRACLFTSNDWLASQVPLKVKKKTPFFNGALACKLWEFAS